MRSPTLSITLEIIRAQESGLEERHLPFIIVTAQAFQVEYKVNLANVRSLAQFPSIFLADLLDNIYSSMKLPIDRQNPPIQVF
jgi:hypothetical protein